MQSRATMTWVSARLRSENRAVFTQHSCACRHGHHRPPKHRCVTLTSQLGPHALRRCRRQGVSTPSRSCAGCLELCFPTLTMRNRVTCSQPSLSHLCHGFLSRCPSTSRKHRLQVHGSPRRALLQVKTTAVNICRLWTTTASVLLGTRTVVQPLASMQGSSVVAKKAECVTVATFAPGGKAEPKNRRLRQVDLRGVQEQYLTRHAARGVADDAGSVSLLWSGKIRCTIWLSFIAVERQELMPTILRGTDPFGRWTQF